MEKQIDFPHFMRALRETGDETPERRFLKDATTVWRELPFATRERTLASLGLTTLIPASAAIRLAKRAGAPSSLDNVLVIFTGEERAPLQRPVEAPATAMPPAARATSAPTPTSSAPGAEPMFAAQAKASPLAPSATAGAVAPAAPTAPVARASAPDAQKTEPRADAEADEEAEPAKKGKKSKKAKKAKKGDAPAPGEKPKKGGLGSLFKRKDAAEAPAEIITSVTEIKPVTDPDIVEIEVYPVQEGYAFIRILQDKKKHEYVYEIIEPELVDREHNILEFLQNTLTDILDVGPTSMSKEASVALIRKHIDEILYDYSINLTPLAKEKILYFTLRDFLGFGRLDPIMRDDLIEDISCDGPHQPIFIYHRKYESLRSSIQFRDHAELDSYVIRMAQRSGKHISIAEPLLDATLPDGSRLNATLSDEVTAFGSTFTIRKFRDDPFTPPDLVRFGTMNADILAYWWLAVQNGASAIYAGGTASGKTTSLNAILLFIPHQMKIVSIEDTREVRLPHPNWIAGVTRSGFGPRDDKGRQAGEIDMFTLLKASLRQRPEYILVGEVRGAEASALFSAMATGHTAYGTMHADSVESVIHRLETEPINIPRSLLEALDIVSVQIQTRIGEKRVRRTKEIVEIVGLDPHTREILTNEVFKWDPATDTFEFSGVSYVLERIQLERNMSESKMREEMAARKELINYMLVTGKRELADVADIIVRYYKEPEATLAKVREEMALAAPKPEAPAVAQPKGLRIAPIGAAPAAPPPGAPPAAAPPTGTKEAGESA